MQELISIRNLNKEFGKVKALNNINLSVYEGEWLAIMGPSGSGKSTLLNILSLMDSPTSGTYLFNGQNLEQINEEDKIKMRREKIGLIFQQFHLIPYLSAFENVMLAQYYHSSIDKDDVKSVLEKVGLAHRMEHLPSQLSGGEQQRVCIARALINDPEILLADEPTGNLDQANEQIVLQILKQLKKEGKTIILITHNADLAQFANRCVFLQHGVLK